MRKNIIGMGLAGAVSLLALVAMPVRAELPVPSVNDLETRSLYGRDAMTAQVNSVSELSDVDPNSWAFQALKTVVERYGCLEGYPNKTYQGNKPLTRYEFAAGLNACLENINNQITAATSTLATREDLATLQRLQDEFAAELAALRGRVDALESKTRELESKLFSTTSKLDAEVLMGLVFQGANSSANIVDGAGNLQGTGGGATTAFGGRTRLNIRANSLVVRGDQLRVRLNARTGQSTYFSSNQGTVGRIDWLNGAEGPTNGAAVAEFDKVYYDFPISIFGGNQNLRVRFGPRVENIDIVGQNRFTISEAQNFSYRNFRKDPLFHQIQEGPVPGVHVDLRFSPAFALRVFYGAANGGSVGANVFCAGGVATSGPNADCAFGGSGLTGGSTQIAAEIGFRPTPSINIGLGYSYVNVSSGSGNSGFIFGNAIDGGGGDGGLRYNPANVSNIGHSIFTANASWDITPGISVFGRYTFDTASFFGRNPAGLTGTRSVGGSIDANSWMAGLAFPDLFGRGNLLEVAYLQPINITNNGVISFVNGVNNPASDPRGYGAVFCGPGAGCVPGVNGTTLNRANGLPFARSGTEGQIALAYRFRLSDRLTITPEALWVISPNNVNQNGITVGNLRATFEF